MFAGVGRVLIALVFISAAFDKIDDPNKFIEQQLYRTEIFFKYKLNKSIQIDVNHLTH